MRKTLFLLSTLFYLAAAPRAAAQVSSDLDIFGYFQTALTHSHSTIAGDENSFSLQQLNLMVQKRLAPRWSAFINFEMVNNYSSDKFWGAFNLEEAWVRYRYDRRLSVRLGLQIPEFNNLNAINNRTPLLPYVIRPLVYETTFSEIIATDEYVPGRAFVQVYGALPAGEAKIDYAAYLGNSPDVASRLENLFGGAQRQTGVDTTNTFLYGGRAGVRYADSKLGLSATYDKTNFFLAFIDSVGAPKAAGQERPRIRVGADLSVRLGRLLVEGEYIHVYHDLEVQEVDFDQEFFYGTAGVDVTEEWLLYGSYWRTQEVIKFRPNNMNLDASGEVNVWGGGVSFKFNDRLNAKAQYAYVEIEGAFVQQRELFNFFSTAISVFF